LPKIISVLRFVPFALFVAKDIFYFNNKFDIKIKKVYSFDFILNYGTNETYGTNGTIENSLCSKVPASI